ncbi:transcriptional repressor [bacterium]|nr:transcriptional repressor [bacterium]MBU1994268.1 transcriptional repressor [bacterium]
MNDYTNILREHNLKATPQRLAIANALCTNGHMSIETLYGIMLKKFSSISLATIYKNINLMLENTFIQEVKLPNAKSVYELTKTPHSHLLCEACGNVEDILLNLNSIIEDALKASEFQIEKTDLVLSGVCKKCRK